MLDPLIEAEDKYIRGGNKKPSTIILGRKQLKMIEELVNYLNDQNMIVFDSTYFNTSKWRGMTIKIDSREDYIGFK